LVDYIIALRNCAIPNNPLGVPNNHLGCVCVYDFVTILYNMDAVM